MFMISAHVALEVKCSRWIAKSSGGCDHPPGASPQNRHEREFLPGHQYVDVLRRLKIQEGAISIDPKQQFRYCFQEGLHGGLSHTNGELVIQGPFGNSL